MSKTLTEECKANLETGVDEDRIPKVEQKTREYDPGKIECGISATNVPDTRSGYEE